MKPPHTSNTVKKKNLLKLNASTVNVIFVKHFDFYKQHSLVDNCLIVVFSN